jgi:AbrB family looped-hinge helix DNA binding protein
MAPGSTISSKGQITVPVEIRRRLGLKEGDRVEFLVEGERMIVRPAQPVVVHPAQPTGDPFTKYVGILPAFRSTSEINAWINDLRGNTSLGE